MIALLGLLPCAVVVTAVLVFKWSGPWAAGLALLTSLALWYLGLFQLPSGHALLHGLADALVLELLVGVVIFGGLLFVEVSRRAGALNAMESIIHATRLNEPQTAILVTVGIGILVESLTGYGVSMLVTVPLLLRLVSRRRTITLALIGMSLMPWGALAVSALLGAELTGIALPTLAEALLYTSGPIALLLPVLCAQVTGRATPADYAFAALAGAALLGGIVLTSRYIGVEVAGVGGALAVLVLLVFFTGQTRTVLATFKAPALWPYPLLIGAIVLQKALIPILSDFGLTLELTTGRVRFDVIASPALALCAASWLSLKLLPTQEPRTSRPLLVTVGARASRALLTVFLFLLTARVLVEIGAIAALAALLSELGPYAAAATVTGLGGLGAYVTGSGVTANALFISGATATGETFGVPVLFAALQHSGAGHVAMASLPVIALLLAAFPQREQSDEPRAVATGLKLAAAWLTMVTLSGFAQLLWQ